jgi:hypothetical protein
MHNERRRMLKSKLGEPQSWSDICWEIKTHLPIATVKGRACSLIYNLIKIRPYLSKYKISQHKNPCIKDCIAHKNSFLMREFFFSAKYSTSYFRHTLIKARTCLCKVTAILVSFQRKLKCALKLNVKLSSDRRKRWKSQKNREATKSIFAPIICERARKCYQLHNF